MTDRIDHAVKAREALEMSDHLFRPVAGHPDDDECTYTDGGVYCGAPEAAHKWSER